jgi:hypothetical protein
MESDDLNQLRLRHRRQEQPAKSAEEQIATLRAEIAELEKHPNDPSELAKFMRLDAAARQECLNKLNSALPPDEQYSMQGYMDELRLAEAEPSLIKLRLAAAKLRLDQLLGPSSRS